MRERTSQRKFALGENLMSALKPKSRLLSLPQAAEELGMSVNTIRAWIYQRKITFVKVGRSVRVSEETVQMIIKGGTVPALVEGR
ncbi:helix-turn-helix domain-containing protein [Granulicella sp. L46]|uniref:helix-turn-helix domain-containing protein n=1 Tax=Granulicella sp. L46 TaxID=1641865 RepID=UPI00131AE09C|nr:helix-turn-helix domain-containing protein [Granulicella sp. L46]